MNKRTWCSAIALASLVSVVGCGGDDGTASGGITAGAGGGAGTGTTAGTGAGGAGGGGAVPCGPKMCMTPMLPAQAAAFGLKPSAACCSDMATGTCGSQMGNMCVPPPPPAPNCPAPPPFMGFAASSCCIQSTQMCGIDASSFGLGCFSLSSIPGIGSGMQMRKCDGTVVMPPGQAGTGGGAGRGAAGGSAGGGATAGTGSSSTAGAGGARAGAGGGSAAGAGAGRGAAGAAGR